jgi:PilZ domain
MERKTDWAGIAEETRLDRRREERRVIRFPIEVSGIDAQGKPFTERTSTEDVSESGVRFSLRMPLEFEAVVAVKLVHQDGPTMFVGKLVLYQVRRVDVQNERRLVGAVKLQSASIWESAGLPPDKDPSPAH